MWTPWSDTDGTEQDRDTTGDRTGVTAGAVWGALGHRHTVVVMAQGCQSGMGTGVPAQGWGHTHPVLAASVLEGAEQHGSAAALFEVRGHVLPGNAGRPALVGAGHGVPGTLVLVVLGQRVVISPCREPAGRGSPWVPSHLDGVEDELLGAVGAGLGALGALGQRVLGQQAPHHAGPTLVLAVHALLGTRALVALGTTAASPSGCPHWAAQPGMGPCGDPIVSPSLALSPQAGCACTVSSTQALSPWPGYGPHGSLHPIWSPSWPHCTPNCTPPTWLYPNGASMSPTTPLPAVSPIVSPPQPCPRHGSPHPTAHLEGLPGEVAGAELALDPALGAAVLDVLGQVPAAQLGAAAVGAGDDVEAAGAKMGLGGAGMVRGCLRGAASAPTSCRTLPGGA